MRISVPLACYCGAMDIETTDDIHEQLEDAFGAATSPSAFADAYRVERTLKRTPAEVTELVWLRTAAGTELGPYVRKVISQGSGLGCAYVELFKLQRQGMRFRQLPRIIDCRESGGSLEVLLEYVKGRTLAQVVADTSPGDRDTLARELVPAICDAVSELHGALESPLVHRDLTPSNVICPDVRPCSAASPRSASRSCSVAGPLSAARSRSAAGSRPAASSCSAAAPLSAARSCRPVLIDFGIARVWREGEEADTTHFGTRSYAPPEQYGFGQTDVRSDVYALGMLAFFCLAGREATPADRECDFACAEVSPAWRGVITKATSLDPDDRYQSVAEMRDELPGAADGRLRMHFGRSGDRSRSLAMTLAEMRERYVSASVPSFWSVRNVVVCLTAAIILFSCAICLFDEKYYVAGPLWLNVYGFALFFPCMVLVCGWVLLDKRWLFANVGFLRRWGRKRARAVSVGVFVVAWLLLIVFVGICKR